MTSRALSSILLLWLLLVAGRCSLFASPPIDAGSGQPEATASSGQQAATDVRGTWSGTFFSKDPKVPPFTMTIIITPNSQGHLEGSSSLNSECLKGAKLHVTVTGSTVVLAGSDEAGDNITVRGTVDNTGTLLKANYILNGSASGRCETDDGAGSLSKQ